MVNFKQIKFPPDFNIDDIGQIEENSMEFMKGKTIEKIERVDFTILVRATDGSVLQVIAPNGSVVVVALNPRPTIPDSKHDHDS